MSLARTAPTGRSVRLVHGDQQLWSVSVGAGLRGYDVGGRALLDGFAADERPGGGRGQTLVPWPNRVAGATYRFDGVEQQLPVTEPATGNAIHGLARWVPWQLLDRTPASVTWGHVIPPQPGWPTSLDCRVGYALDDGGLTVTTTATNVGDAPCPYGTGTHPYLRVGDGPVDAMTLQVPAGTWYDVDPGHRRSTASRRRTGTSFPSPYAWSRSSATGCSTPASATCGATTTAGGGCT